MPSTRKLKSSLIIPDRKSQEAPTSDTIARATKIAQVIEMLQRSGGATLAELVAMTSWLPHTTRAALTGLRKKGYTLDKQCRDGVTVYAIAKAG